MLNPTNHTYWNLAGAGDVLLHELRVNASRYVVADSALIPTGELRAVTGTPLDFTQTKPVGRPMAPASACMPATPWSAMSALPTG